MERLRYIQNRRHWCWAVACRMAGEQYKKQHAGYGFSIIGDRSAGHGYVTEYEYENGVVTDDPEGINWSLQRPGKIRVDAWQRAIVMNANTGKYTGYDGDVDGDDEAKIRGIRYYLTGNIYSDSMDIETLGSCDAAVSLWDKYRDRLLESAGRQEYLIGNAVMHGGRAYHTFVILCITGEKVMLYDTADGGVSYCTADETFRRGFESGSGRGIVKWVQRIL